MGRVNFFIQPMQLIQNTPAHVIPPELKIHHPPIVQFEHQAGFSGLYL
jgi:hypothetical protein